MTGMHVRASGLRWMLLALLIVTSLGWPATTFAGEEPNSAEPTATQETTGTTTVETEEPVETVEATETPTPTEEATIEPTATTTPPPTEAPPTETAFVETPTATPTETPVIETPTAEPTRGETGPAETVGTATLNVRTVDQTGAPVPQAMYVAYRDLGGGTVGETLGYAWDGEPSDGTATFVDLPTVAIVVRQYSLPRGYIPTTEIFSFTLTAGEVRTIEVIAPYGGKLTVHAVDEHNQPLVDGCFTAYVDNGGTRGEAVRGECDPFSGPNDGTTVVDGLPAGSYLLGSTSSGPNYLGGADVPFTIDLGGTAEVTVQFVPKGTIVIHKRTADNQPLAGACFSAYTDEGGGQHSDFAVGGRCDYDDGAGDGLITFPAPPGNLVVVEDQTPYGYVAAPPIQVTIASQQTVELTVVDPLASTLVISVTDLWGTPFAPACIELFSTNADGTRGSSAGVGCTYHFGEFNKVRFGPLQPGRYLISGSSVNTGMHLDADVPVDIGLSETVDLTVKFNSPAPALAARPVVASLTQTSAVIYWETDQPTVGTVEYGLTTNLGRRRPISAAPESKVQRVELSPLEPGRTYYFRVRSTNPNGEVTSELSWFRTPGSTATASLEITKVNSDGSRVLAGACFELYQDAGGGSLGAFAWSGCDKYDATPNDGKLKADGLVAGSYVLVETVSPMSYVLGKNVLVTLTAGQTRQVTVKNSRGGAVLTIETYAFTGSSDAPKVPGACYTVYANVNGAVGKYVTFNCDDFDGLDGITTIGALHAGKYFVRLEYTPKGYLASAAWELEIASGQRTASHTDVLTPVSDPGNAVLRTVDSNGNLLVGACFALYQVVSGPDPYLSSACDGDDGRLDGQTVFVSLPGIHYAVYEYAAPSGYQVGTRVGFAKTDGRLRTVTIVQTPGGVRVRVTTLNGSTSSVLPGACYTLVKSGDGAFTTGACDSNRDGIIVMEGVPPGTYQLVQTGTPPGYRRPPIRTITVGSSNVSTRIRTYPAT
jgi:uncharacterized surface anchored protein